MIRKKKIAYLVTVLLFAVSLSSCCWFKDCVRPPTNEEYYKAQFKLAAIRNLATDEVKKAREVLKDKPDIIAEVQAKYDKAKQKGNALIDTIRMAITAADPNAKFDDLSKEVADAVTELVAYVEAAIIDAKKPPAPPGPEVKSLFSMNTLVAGEIISGTLEGLAKAGVVIWRAGKEQEAKVAERVKEELERNRWQDWDKIGA